MTVFFLFIFGLVIGSFLGAYIIRFGRGESVARGRSHCDHCNHQLSWLENIPLLSWLLQKGRCRHCRKKLGLFYPTIEVATALSFVTIGILFTDNLSHVGQIVRLGFILITASSLIVVFFTDLIYGLIPDSAVLTGVLATLVLKIFGSGNVAWDFAAAVSVTLFFLTLVLVTKGKGMGWGDVKFAFMLGLICGFPKTLVAVFFAFVVGAAWSVALIILKRKTLKQTIHFGPFLVLSIPVAVIFGDQILRIYLGM